MTLSLDRRAFLAVAGSLAVGVPVALAGCTGSARSNGDAYAPAGERSDADYDEWLDGVDGYDGPVDRTGHAEAVVEVGAGRGLAFDPAAVRVSRGTTVVWEWTGRGGHHDVRSIDGTFASERTDAAGARFAHPFAESGVYRYVCSPHETMRMKGVVIVD